MGAHSTGKGAAIGGVIAVLTPALLGPSVLVGVAAGALHQQKNLGLSDADKARLTVELNSGKAAVAVMARSDTASAIADHLAQLGGTSSVRGLAEDALKAAAATNTAAV